MLWGSRLLILGGCVVFVGLTLLHAQISTFPYVENFDGGAVPSLPLGWSTTTNRLSTGDFATVTSSPRSSPHCALSTNATIAQILISPAFNFKNRTPDKLQFYTARSGTHIAGLLIEASTDNGATFPIQLSDTIKNPGSTAYVLTSIQLPASLENQSSVRFRWRLVPASTGTTGTFRVDDVSITVLTSFDIALRSIAISPLLPSTSDSLIITARVRNLGTQPASAYAVEFYRDVNNNFAAEIAERFASIPGPSLRAGDSAEVVTGHPALPFGDHRLFVVVNFADDEVRSNDTLSINVPVGYAPGAILVNEIMYAPLADEPEWIELVNTTSDTINMRNWRISDSNTGTKTIISVFDFKISPLSYAIVAKDANFLTVHPTVMVPVAIANFSALNNTTPDAVVVYDTRTATIDSVMYSPTWGGLGGKSLERIDIEVTSYIETNWATSTDSLGRTPGLENSIARKQIDLAIGQLTAGTVVTGNQIVPSINFDVVNLGKQVIPQGFVITYHADTNKNGQFESFELFSQTVFAASVPPGAIMPVVFLWDDAPPGQTFVRVSLVLPTDQRPTNNIRTVPIDRRYESGILVVNEIMYDPVTGQNEWVEFYHRGSTAIDISRWRFTDQPTTGGSMNTFTITPQSNVVLPGDYVVVAADSTVFGLFPGLRAPSSGRHVFILNRSGGFSFGNDGDDIVLNDHTGSMIDSVSYSPRWHNPQVIDTKGRSLERINHDLGSNDQRNWSTASSLQGGTPGGANSIFTTSLPTAASLSFSPNPFSPDGDGFEDFCIIRYNLPQTTSLIQVRIFDIRGRLIRTLASLEPAGAQGELIWDGLDDERQRVRIGTYVVFIEASDSEAKRVSTTKGVVVVATRL